MESPDGSAVQAATVKDTVTSPANTQALTGLPARSRLAAVCLPSLVMIVQSPRIVDTKIEPRSSGGRIEVTSKLQPNFT